MLLLKYFASESARRIVWKGERSWPYEQDMKFTEVNEGQVLPSLSFSYENEFLVQLSDPTWPDFYLLLYFLFSEFFVTLILYIYKKKMFISFLQVLFNGLTNQMLDLGKFIQLFSIISYFSLFIYFYNFKEILFVREIFGSLCFDSKNSYDLRWIINLFLV